MNLRGNPESLALGCSALGGMSTGLCGPSPGPTCHAMSGNVLMGPRTVETICGRAVGCFAMILADVEVCSYVSGCSYLSCGSEASLGLVGTHLSEHGQSRTRSPGRARIGRRVFEWHLEKWFLWLVSKLCICFKCWTSLPPPTPNT